MFHENPFYEIAAILGLSALLGLVGQKLRQPLLIMFLATGILAGPTGLGIIESYGEIELLAHIGIALLLFIVGLKLDLHLIRTVGPVALAAGLGQIVFTTLIGFFICLWLEMTVMSAAYVAVALTFSSTIIIVKLLSDKKEIDSLHGQIAIGFLIVQDIAAILALVGLTSIAPGLSGGGNIAWTLMLIALKGSGLLGFLYLFTKFVIPLLMSRIAGTQEMLSLFSIAWAVAMGGLSDAMGFSKEVGAFLAGVSLASTDYRDALGARLSSLRDFLLLFFFIDLGARMEWVAIWPMLSSSVLLSLFVLIGNPLIVVMIMGWMGYRRRTGFMAGLAVAQISEFSLILTALGHSMGHISREIMGLVTLVGVITIFASTYLILYSAPLYNFFKYPLRFFERDNPYREASISPVFLPMVDVILLGLGNYGGGLAEILLQRHKSLIGVDFDPSALERWRQRGVPVFYGDFADPEIQEQLPLERSRWIASSVRSRDLNLALNSMFRNRGYRGRIAVTAANQAEAEAYQMAGAHVVFRPYLDAAEQAIDALSEQMDILPGSVEWPIAFREARINTGAAYAGEKVRNIPLRSITGVSILAVSRAGRLHNDPAPDFQLLPGDRVILIGPQEALEQAEALLNESHSEEPVEAANRFVISETSLDDASLAGGKTLADLQFRQKYGVTVVGIRRGMDRILSPSPSERIHKGDILVVVGTEESVNSLTASSAA